MTPEKAILFRRPLTGSAAVLFGEPAEQAIALAVRIKLPLTLSVRLHAAVPAVGVAVTVHMPALTARAALSYDNAVLRAPVCAAQTFWPPSRSLGAPIGAPIQDATRCPSEVRPRWLSGVRRQALTAAAWAQLARAAVLLRPEWGEALRRASGASTPWRSGLRTRRPASAIRWGQGLRLSSAPTLALWYDRLRTARPQIVALWHAGRTLEAQHTWITGRGIPLRLSHRVRWGDGMHPKPGVSAPVTPLGPVHFVPSAAILFRNAFTGTAAILFNAPDRAAGQIVVPILRSYTVINNVTLVRAADGHVFNGVSLSISADVDSFQIGFSASLPGTAFDDVMPAPDPVELIASINGIAYQLVIRSVSRERTFGKASVSISGQGWAAALADPFAAAQTWTNSEIRTAQQLAAEVLPLGWTLDWQLDDWVVPAGAWSFSGTPAAALSRIAEAAGGYVAPARSAKSVAIRHRYPLAPWAWGAATPDIILPADPVTKEGIEVADKAVYNSVYVSGESVGPLAHVIRAGTAGDLQSAMITDALITDDTAARQRGRAVLSDVGLQLTPTLTLPVLPSTGIIDLGKIIDFVDGSTTRRGIVRAYKVDATMPKVRQSIEVETHVNA